MVSVFSTELKKLLVMHPKNTGQKQVGRFQKGVSGNPSGRPKGSCNATTLAAQELLRGEAEALTRKAIELALGGNLIALRLCFDRILPVLRGAPQIDLGPLQSASQLQSAFDRVVQSLASGQITSSELSSILGLFSEYMKFTELCDFEQRLKTVEGAIANAQITDGHETQA